MKPRLYIWILFFIVSGPVPGSIREAFASGPIIARGEQRDAIKSQHILNRPNRPLHVYGNTVRRRSHR